MSATVTVVNDRGLIIHEETVPKANSYEIDKDTGWIHLRTSQWGGDKIAVFKSWEHVVITPDRGANGRFVKKV